MFRALRTLVVLVLVAAPGMGCSTHLGRPATAADLKILALDRPSEMLMVRATAPDTGQSTSGRPLTLSPTQVEVWDASRGQRIWLKNEDVQEIDSRRSRIDATLLGAGIGVAMGAVIGAGVGYASYTDPCAEDNSWGCLDFGPIIPALDEGSKGALIGAVVGGLVGILIPVTDRYIFGAAAKAEAEQRSPRRTLDSPPE